MALCFMFFFLLLLLFFVLLDWLCHKKWELFLFPSNTLMHFQKWISNKKKPNRCGMSGEEKKPCIRPIWKSAWCFLSCILSPSNSPSLHLFYGCIIYNLFAWQLLFPFFLSLSLVCLHVCLSICVVVVVFFCFYSFSVFYSQSMHVTL